VPPASAEDISVIIRRCAPFVWAALLACGVSGAPPASAADPSPAKSSPPSPIPTAAAPGPAITHHTLTAGGRTIAYTARAGLTVLRNADNEEIARVFSVAYTADGADPRTRPVTFLWNGGPGSSSMWLHMASFGPQRVPVPSDATPPAPGIAASANPDSLIDTTDLVFIDAVGTGYSEISGTGTAKTFFGVDEDALAFERFIRSWVNDNDRYVSPKYLFGESYGTMRAALVVDGLQKAGMAIDGVVLISSAIDFNVLDNGQGPGEDYQYISFLPTEAAVAWYHHRVAGAPPDLAAFVGEVRAFALGPYADALMRGDDLDPATRRSIIAKLHGYTGLDPAYIDRADLRIDPSRFEHALLGTTGTLTGRLDGRYRGPELDRTADSASYDPTSDDLLTDALVGAFGHYVRDELGYKVERPYLGTNYAVVDAHWNGRRANSIVAASSARDLREALIKNPYLRVFAANGYYDLATPFFGTEYTLNHLGLDAAARSRIEYGFYPSGHMIYLNDDARRALRADLVRFYQKAAVR